MRERQFIEQNQAKWEEFEALFENKASVGQKSTGRNDPGRLRRLYVEITEDLAYARTFYPNRTVRVYLNNLAQRVVQRIHGARKRRYSWRESGFRHFWVEALPRVLYDSRKDILLALIVFLLSVGIGVLSASQDNTFAQLILGDQYVAMTEANIEEGDPMAVYKDSPPFPMFVRIALNNLFVDALTFAAGAVFAVGAMFVLLINGIMVGAFQHFFVEFGLFRESFLTIWQHGTLEMSAAVLSGAAGMAMGRGVVFPGTYTRMQGFRLAARRAVRIMALVVPMTLTAAVIESWLTRMTEIPDLLRAMSIGVSLFLVLGYVWWYPRLRARQGWSRPDADARLPEPRPQDVRLDQTRSAGESFTLAFAVYRRLLPFWLPRVLLVCLGLGLAAARASDWLAQSSLWFYQRPFAADPFYFLGQMGDYLNATAQFGNSYAEPWLLLLHVLGVYAALWVVLRQFGGLPQNGMRPQSGHARWWRHGKLLILVLLQCLLLLLPKPWGKLAFIFCLPITALSAAAIWFETAALGRAFGRAFALYNCCWGVLLGAYVASALISFISVWLINSPLMGLWWDALEQNFLLDETSAFGFRVGTVVFTAWAAFVSLLPLSLAALVGVFFHAREVREATGLKRAWNAFGERQNRWV